MAGGSRPLEARVLDAVVLGRESPANEPEVIADIDVGAAGLLPPRPAVRDLS